MGRLDMHTLQEFVRLARMGTGFRAVARMLRISPNTEREYRKVFEAEGLLVGDPNDLPEVAVLHAMLEKHRPARLAPQQDRADALGHEVDAYIRDVFASDDVLLQRKRSMSLW